ncbi:hypothetical protein C4D60_Mb11t08020 [Musa balbisiana]|uniref:Uncharacterized protein n=1 Tax=Musa balbisiana TaxID=52838 RepID=A0A4V4H5D1_MUSBA|nr:hypothetical protein C4D60_Mb11t08020 [Musa balbisiana]
MAALIPDNITFQRPVAEVNTKTTVTNLALLYIFPSSRYHHRLEQAFPAGVYSIRKSHPPVSKHPAMASLRSCVIWVVIVVSIAAISSIERADAARPAPGGFDGANYLAYTGGMYEKARAALATWMARLPSGSSPKGPGH